MTYVFTDVGSDVADIVIKHVKDPMFPLFPPISDDERSRVLTYMGETA